MAEVTIIPYEGNMTREDAIDILRCRKDGDAIEALEMAIEALEQEPCEDCINRQAAIEMAYDMSEIDGEHFTKPCMVVNVEDIQKLPSVTPEPKTGHWEQYGEPWDDKFKCSECGKDQSKILCGERIIGHWSDYCPNCGAKMIEPQESEVEE